MHDAQCSMLYANEIASQLYSISKLQNVIFTTYINAMLVSSTYSM